MAQETKRQSTERPATGRRAKRQRVVLISGGSGGIGKAVARQFVAAGHIVYECSRSGRDEPGIRHITADVTCERASEAAVRRVTAEQGRLDILICNAGYGIAGPLETSPMDDVLRQFDVNFHGTVRLIRAAVPALRRSGGGRIIVVSSVAAVLSVPFQIFYSCTKAALNQLVLGLNNELRPDKIEAVALMPGDIRTAFTEHRVYACPPSVARKHETQLEQAFEDPSPDPIYGNRASCSIRRMEQDERAGGSPTGPARRIVQLAVRKRRPKPLQGYGFVYRLILGLAKFLPVRLTNYLLYRMYAR